MLSKLDLAVIVASVLFGLLWIEHEHRIVIDAPTQAELAAAAAAAAACPDNDSVPYSTACLDYLKGATTAGMTWRANAAEMPPRLSVRSTR
jgi:hypothetical protein